MSIRRGILVASVVISLVPGVAYAHAAYKDSDPKDEATVSSPPSSVWAEYTEPVQEGYLNVFDPCGIQVDDGNTQVTGYRMTVGMSANVAGTYAVRWKAASAVDPHVTSGTFTFTVTSGESCAADDEEEPAPEERAERSQRDDSARSGNVSDVATSENGSASRRNRVATGKKENSAKVNGARQGRRSRTDGARQIELAQSSPSDAERGIWDGIPLGGFLLAMAIAAAIGAAGGRIYANIMGPRR
ncbi:MAG: copper resistance protein CopC [Actinomycetota bacterium]|nr:copper resistance protein CopC [Actinomycetota bacterium]